MNNRDYKQFAAGEYYHFYNRGNGKQNVFIQEADFRFFLMRLKENIVEQYMTPPRPGHYMRQLLPAGAFTVICYCIMPNHFHLLCRQNTDLPLYKLMHQVCTSYSKYFNKKYERVGHVFQDQYKAVRIINDNHLIWISAYIHQNPKVGGLVEDLANYQWSSYLDFIQKRHGVTVCDTQPVMSQFRSVLDYERFVSNSFSVIRDRKDVEYALLDT